MEGSTSSEVNIHTDCLISEPTRLWVGEGLLDYRACEGRNEPDLHFDFISEYQNCNQSAEIAMPRWYFDDVIGMGVLDCE